LLRICASVRIQIYIDKKRKNFPLTILKKKEMVTTKAAAASDEVENNTIPS